MGPGGGTGVVVNIEWVSFRSKPSLPTLGEWKSQLVDIGMCSRVSGGEPSAQLLLELRHGVGMGKSTKVHLSLIGSVCRKLTHVKRESSLRNIIEINYLRELSFRKKTKLHFLTLFQDKILLSIYTIKTQLKYGTIYMCIYIQRLRLIGTPVNRDNRLIGTITQEQSLIHRS